jgi:thioredoxin reductase
MAVAEIAEMSIDVVIVGGGPAGLSAALILGRAGRAVMLCDRGTPRSWASKAMHGFLTREGIHPEKFRQLARRELRKFRNVHYARTEVTDARRFDKGGFEVATARGARVRCRKLLIATGVLDHLPPIAGVEKFFGKSVFQCPYCDGWETRHQPLAVYGRRERGLEMARALTAWNHDIVLCSDGPSGFSAETREHLRRNQIRLIEERVLRLEGSRGQLRAVVFRNGRRIERSALYFDTASSAQSRLAESLGCRFNRQGGIRCGQYEATDVPGVFVAGNIIRDVQLSIVAAAEGAKAAFGINRALTREDFERRATGRRTVKHAVRPNPTEVPGHSTP